MPQDRLFPGQSLHFGDFLNREGKKKKTEDIWGVFPDDPGGESMWFELLILVIGIGYGYFVSGKQDLWGILKQGAIVGVILGIIFGLIAFFLAPEGFSIAAGIGGAIGIVIGIIILVVIFIVGVFIGDMIEGTIKKR
jgi:hypothetical protein